VVDWSALNIAASVVLYHHTAEAVAPTVRSILASSLITRLTIVDNGGGSWARGQADGRVTYLDAGRNLGYGAGHNLAIRTSAATVDYYAVVNPDVAFEAGTLERLAAFAERRKAGLVMPDVRYPDGRRQYLCKLLPTPLNLFARRFLPSAIVQRLDERYELHAADYRQPFFVPCLSGCFMLFDARVLLAVGGFDERFHLYLEDTDLSRRVAERAPTLYCPEAQVVHAFNKLSYRDPGLLKVHVQSALRYFNKWGWCVDGGRRRLNQRCLAELPYAVKR